MTTNITPILSGGVEAISQKRNAKITQVLVFNAIIYLSTSMLHSFMFKIFEFNNDLRRLYSETFSLQESTTVDRNDPPSDQSIELIVLKFFGYVL
uniref:Uncharacterized protein n=1 Tax=Romanomermis culicivorax TaxID=13658 RepID=A0A915HVR8_ROMCU